MKSLLYPYGDQKHLKTVMMTTKKVKIIDSKFYRLNFLPVARSLLNYE